METVPKYNRKIVQNGKIYNPLTHNYITTHSPVLAQATPICVSVCVWEGEGHYSYTVINV